MWWLIIPAAIGTYLLFSSGEDKPDASKPTPGKPKPTSTQPIPTPAEPKPTTPVPSSTRRPFADLPIGTIVKIKNGLVDFEIIKKFEPGNGPSTASSGLPISIPTSNTEWAYLGRSGFPTFTVLDFLENKIEEAGIKKS